MFFGQPELEYNWLSMCLGEVLRDEQIYLAHKAANPSKYGPGEAYLKDYPEAAELVKKYKPTDVQLQVWDDLCHVAPTLSFTRPAKFMYRSVAQFGAWALARAQKTEIEIMDDDDVSVISSGSDTDTESDEPDLRKPQSDKKGKDGGDQNGGAFEKIGKAGDALPTFRGHMIRQRVDRHGLIHPLDPPSALPALQVSLNEVGVVKPGLVRKWMAAKSEWDSKFAKEKRRVQKRRIKDMVRGYDGFGNDEVPPPSALAGRRGVNMPKQSKIKRSWGMSLWSLWGSSHDEKTVICPSDSFFTSNFAASSSGKKKQTRNQIPVLPRQVTQFKHPAVVPILPNRALGPVAVLSSTKVKLARLRTLTRIAQSTKSCTIAPKQQQPMAQIQISSSRPLYLCLAILAKDHQAQRSRQL